MGTQEYVPWRPQFDALFNSGRFKDAYRFLLKIEDRPGAMNDAGYWAKRAMCELSTKNGLVSAHESIEKARRCVNWEEPDMSNALVRDLVIHIIRFHKSTMLAWHYLDELLRFVTDPNLKACYKMLQGRLLAKDGKLEDALLMHRAALYDWNGLGDRANKQWVMNNNWWMFVTMVRVMGAFGQGITLRPKPDDYEQMYQAVLRDPRKSRVRTARLLNAFGKPVAKFVGN